MYYEAVPNFQNSSSWRYPNQTDEEWLIRHLETILILGHTSLRILLVLDKSLITYFRVDSLLHIQELTLAELSFCFSTSLKKKIFLLTLLLFNTVLLFSLMLQMFKKKKNPNAYGLVKSNHFSFKSHPSLLPIFLHLRLRLYTTTTSSRVVFRKPLLQSKPAGPVSPVLFWMVTIGPVIKASVYT